MQNPFDLQEDRINAPHGVDGSSPSEGSAEPPHIGLFISFRYGASSGAPRVSQRSVAIQRRAHASGFLATRKRSISGLQAESARSTVSFRAGRVTRVAASD